MNMYRTCTIIVLLKKTNGMAFNSTTHLKLIYWFTYHQSIVHLKKMSIVLYIPMYLYTRYILLITIAKYNTVIYKNNI
jgi:hypothetical protein